MNRRQRRAITRIVLAGSILALLALAAGALSGRITAGQALTSAGWPLAGIVSGTAYLRSTR